MSPLPFTYLSGTDNSVLARHCAREHTGYSHQQITPVMAGILKGIER